VIIFHMHHLIVTLFNELNPHAIFAVTIDKEVKVLQC
jgi:hypothetical protein